MGGYRVDVLQTEEAVRSIHDDWTRLSQGLPFSSFEWMLAAWKHLEQQKNSLHVLVIRDSQERVLGIAPWALQPSHFLGNTLRFLGSGKACSDYLRILCGPPDTAAVVDATVRWMLQHQLGGQERGAGWSFLDFDGVRQDCEVMNHFLNGLQSQGITIHRDPQENSWRVSLADTWEDYLSSCSAKRRRFIKKTMQVQQTHQVQVQDACLSDANESFQRFEDLHQLRRRSLGQLGCFDTPGFRGFLKEMTQSWLPSERLVLRTLFLDGRAAASGWYVVDNGTFYVYQTGMNPEMSELNPGWLMILLNMQDAMSRGLQHFDFLRGNEEYKRRLAEPVPLCRIRGVANQRYCEAIDALRRKAVSLRQRLRKWQVTADSPA